MASQRLPRCQRLPLDYSNIGRTAVSAVLNGLNLLTGETPVLLLFYTVNFLNRGTPHPEQEEILQGLHPLEIKLLQSFRDKETLASKEIIDIGLMDESRLDTASNWLIKKGLIEISGEDITSSVSLTETGKDYYENNIPELRILSALHEGKSLTVKDISQTFHLDPLEVSSALGLLKESGVTQIVQGGLLELKSGGDANGFESLQDLIRFIGEKGIADLNLLSNEQREIIEVHCRKRGKSKGIFRISEKKNRIFSLTGSGKTILSVLPERGETGKEVSQLTPEMLKEGTWRNITFRKYNISLNPPRISIGKKHPYREFLDFVKYKFVAMGFEEVRGPLIENEFWNMDALYMPQFHPARDIHDVYFIKEPSHCKEIEKPFGNRVAETHTNGGNTGSKGWRYPFDLKRAKRLILRSQGTTISARTLALKPKIPGKYFSIARCFRYDTVDATHAPDFYQIEGIVIGEEINFKTLLGLLRLLGEEVAMVKEFRFLPAYFPFTEPSVELHGKHPKLGWIELGGAGIFRPEVTIPLDVKEPVIAWGLGLDRMAMVALGINDIRDLFSRDLDFIRTKKTGFKG